MTLATPACVSHFLTELTHPPRFRGYREASAPGSIAGWAIDTQKLGEPVALQLLLNGVPLLATQTSIARPDLSEVVGTTLNAGFYFCLTTPEIQRLARSIVGTGSKASLQLQVLADGAIIPFQHALTQTLDLPQLAKIFAWSAAPVIAPTASPILPHQKPPLISIIVRTHNRAALLQEAIASITAQEYPNMELIVVNDGGSSVASLLHAGGAIVALHYIELAQNQGRAAAANVGLVAAQGEYCLFLDDDDLLMPNHLSGLVEALGKQPHYLAAYSRVRMQPKAAHLPEEWQEPYDRQRLLRRNLFAIHTVLFAKALLQHGCRFDLRLPIAEDWDFWLQLSRHTDFLAVAQCSAIYRALGNSGGSPWQPTAPQQKQIEAIFQEKWHR